MRKRAIGGNNMFVASRKRICSKQNPFREEYGG